MERFFVIAILIGAAWAFDQLALNGWYTAAVSQEVNYEAQQFSNDVNGFLRQYGLSRPT